MKKILLALIMSFTLTQADNAKNFYYGLNTNIADSYNSNSLDVVSRITVGGQVGVTLLRQDDFEAGIEGRYSTQLNVLFDTYSTQVLAKGAYNLDIIEVYGLLGYGFDESLTESQDGVAYGFGIGLEVSRYNVFIDYIEKDNTGDARVTLGMNYKF